MSVIHLKDWRSLTRRGQQPKAPAGGPVLPPPAQPHLSQDDLDDRRRMQENLVVLAVVAILLVSGVWLIDRLHTYSRIQTCLEAGHRNCIPIDIPQPAGGR